MNTPSNAVGVVAISSSCEQIIWDSKSVFAFGVGCIVGKGRTIVLGKENYFSDLSKSSSSNNKQLYSNMLKWMGKSFKEEPKVVYSARYFFLNKLLLFINTKFFLIFF